MDSNSDGGAGMTDETLTRRQRQVSELLAKGLRNKQIAEELGISPRTVEDHRSVIFEKLCVRNAVELTRKLLGVE